MAGYREDAYFVNSQDEEVSYLSSFYDRNDTNYIEIPLPKGVKVINADGSEGVSEPSPRKATQSIFNRYSLFYYNSISLGPEAEPYFDKPNRLDDAVNAITKTYQNPDALTLDGVSSGVPKEIKSTWKPGAQGLQDVLSNPTASNIIRWSQQGKGDPRLGTNAVEYAWEDFLWCKNYGIVPNNYMVTLRRFDRPVTDDLLDSDKIIVPDISRMLCWIDGESNTWESVGLKFSSSIKWKELESEIQTIQGQAGSGSKGGNEGAAIGGKFGNALKSIAWITQKPPGSPPAAYASSSNSPQGAADPYANANATFGPLDVIKKMWMRDKGLEFEQVFTLKFEYELRSIDGINPRVAMIDLLSNVFVMTANRGEFWGGDIRYFNGSGGSNQSKKVGPFGDPKKLLAGDYSGYFKSLTDGIKSRFDKFSGCEGLTLEGLANAGKNLAGNLISNAIGGALDSTPGGGGAGAQALNSLLTGEETGHWHVMVGNPARPIISVGNLICDKTEYHLHGPLGNDDFPSKLTVTINLKPARMRDRSDMIAMFHRGGRTYTTLSPDDKKYKGNKAVPGKRKGSTRRSSAQSKSESFTEEEAKEVASLLLPRFPNHDKISAVLTQVAEGIY